MSGDIQFHFKLQRQGFQLNAEGSIPAAGVNALYGVSGCGKTTLLRCIAGLEQNVTGFFTINGERWLHSDQNISLSPHQRGTGYVFQETALFPNLNVQENLLYGWRRTPHKSRQHQPSHIIGILGLEPLLQRNSFELSGGERQRVAIGRALLNSPQLLLMDEPMSALDRSRKREILPYLELLHTEAKIPIIYVSHDLEELISVADQLTLMEAGKIINSGPIATMLVNTRLSIGMSEDAGALISAQIVRHDEQFHLSQLDFSGGKLTVSRIGKSIGTEVKLRIHAKDVSLTLEHPGATSILNILPATVTELVPQDKSRVIVRMDVGGVPLLARITQKSVSVLALKPGMRIFAQIKSVALHA